MFEEALRAEPGLPLAYMNLSAVYQQMKKFDQAIEEGKKAIDAAKKAGDKTTQAKANFNVGLAIFSAAAERYDIKDLSSEPFFKESQRLDPSIGANYFYLGVQSECIKKELGAASEYYAQGCERKYAQACTAQNAIKPKLKPAKDHK